jgi:nicotinamidase-related amidase
MKRILLALLVASLGATTWAETVTKPPMLTLHTRGLKPPANVGEKFTRFEEAVQWNPQRTALIVVDMWDDHWCRGAADRVVEMAGPLNEFVAKARDAGVLVVHAPSTCVDFYKETPARRRAIEAPYAKPPMELASEQRWGTAWDYPDEPREPPMPIDDSDMGCDCAVKCEISAPWKRQIAAVTIDDERDAVTDNGQELVNLFAERSVDNVIICGVHLNMCVLGRPFAIRQLVKMGKNVVLVRDLTDTMYNHEMAPHVDHFAGTDLVVEHVEKYWCPTIVSSDLTGGKPFRFAAQK